ncbi:signal recognition particle-docking protein FtsY [Lapidilactobacillus wuchangensis]|uniref:signal recognition particle-docking protein FtsY n=1 Tax=Lapidilactobacillus wuchangensis TaxID=2486001 RepID=UPI000F79ECF6|nr:signal recognition particle-docking protein FtsY [Lapidilactobacillus wuchangensis]
MGFFDRVKKAFGGGKAEETPTAKKDSEGVQSQASDEPAAATTDSQNQVTTEQNAASDQQQPAATSETPTTATEATPETDSKADSITTTTTKTAADQSESVADQVEQAQATAATTVDFQSTSEAQPAESAPNTASDSGSTDEAQATPTSSSQQSEPAEPVTSTAAETASSETAATVATSTSAATDYDRGLAKSRHGFAARLNEFLAGFRSVDEDFFENLEEMLIEADVGFETAMTISNQLRDEVKLQNAKTKKQVGLVIVEKMVDLYGDAGAEEDNQLHFAAPAAGPTVFLFVGVNGAGKTTTVGKLSAQLKAEGKKVLLAACDTFRAGAIEQLAEWARRVDVDIVKSEPGADPASVVFEAVKKAKAEDYDVLLVDTAGRLQNKVNLMNELAKMKRVIVRELPEAPQEVLLVLDASTGQNALSQAKQFQETTDVTGIVLTKLDGSSKGGIVIAIRNELHLPVKLVGLGEHVGDLQAFDAEKFVYGLFKGLIDGADN